MHSLQQKLNIFDVTTCRNYLIRVHGLPPPTVCIVSHQKRCTRHTPTNSGVHFRSKDVTQTQQQLRPASPTATFWRCINKYTVHKLHWRFTGTLTIAHGHTCVPLFCKLRTTAERPYVSINDHEVNYEISFTLDTAQKSWSKPRNKLYNGHSTKTTELFSSGSSVTMTSL